MGQIILDTQVKKGHIELKELPFEDGTEVKVVIIPKINWAKMSFEVVQKLTEKIKGNLSDDITEERKEKRICFWTPMLL